MRARCSKILFKWPEWTSEQFFFWRLPARHSHSRAEAEKAENRHYFSWVSRAAENRIDFFSSSPPKNPRDFALVHFQSCLCVVLHVFRKIHFLGLEKRSLFRLHVTSSSLSSSKLEIPASRARLLVNTKLHSIMMRLRLNFTSSLYALFDRCCAFLFDSIAVAQHTPRNSWKLRNFWKRLFTTRQRETIQAISKISRLSCRLLPLQLMSQFGNTHADSSSLSENFRVISCTHRTVAAYCAVPLCQHTSHCFQVHTEEVHGET